MVTTLRIAAALVLATLLAAPPARAQSGQIESIDGSTVFLGVRALSVPIVDRTQVGSLVDGGTIDTDGYSRIVLNLAGRVAGESGFKSGAVGAILVPDVEPFAMAYRTHGLLPSSIEIAAPADAATATFMAKQVTFDVGFPRYRVLFYNSTGHAATVNFFVYRHRT